MKLGSTIFILGSGGFARELKTYLQAHTQSPHLSRSRTFDQILYDIGCNIFLVSDDGDLTVKEYHNKLSGLLVGDYYSIMGSGHCHIKAKMQKEIRGTVMSFIHPASRVMPESTIGKGSVIAPGVVVAPRVVLGEHVLANYNCTIGHDTIIGDMSVIGPNAAVGGTCRLGDRVYVGSGATIKENITIGDGSVVGMGAALTKNMPAEHIAIGIPARIIPLYEWKKTKSEETL